MNDHLQISLIPYYIGISIFTLFTVYHVRMSSTFMGNYKDKMYYYYSHLITVIPALLYLSQVLDFLLLNTINYSNALKVFYIEWFFPVH